MSLGMQYANPRAPQEHMQQLKNYYMNAPDRNMINKITSKNSILDYLDRNLRHESRCSTFGSNKT